MKKIQAMMVAMLAIVPMLCAWGGGTAYSRLYVKVSSEQVGMGKVYASDSSSVDASLFKETSEDSYKKSGNNNIITLYAHAQANVGYDFVGWSETEGGEIVSQEATCSADIKCPSTPSSSTDTYNSPDVCRWANFKLTDYPAFQVTFKTVEPAEAGSYTVDSGVVDAETVLPAVPTNHLQKFNLAATPSSDYLFVRWYLDGTGETISTDATATYSATHGVAVGAEFRVKNDVVIHFQPTGIDGVSYTVDGSDSVADSVVDKTYERAETKSVSLALSGSTDKQPRWWYRETGNDEKVYMTYAKSLTRTFEGEVDVGVDFLSAEDCNFVARIGDEPFDNIDEAINAWGNNTTLTLLSDVTLTDVIELQADTKHTLNLGSYVMTAASGKNAIQINKALLSSAADCLIINADAENPGGITATGKYCIYYYYPETTSTEFSEVKSRPIITINGGVFNAGTVIWIGKTGSNGTNNPCPNGTNCPQVRINGGVFNGTTYALFLNRALTWISGGTFNQSSYISVDSSAYMLVKGGRFKPLLTSSDLNADKWAYGTEKNKYNVDVYMDDEGYYVVKSPLTEKPGAYEASFQTTSGTTLQYSSASNTLYYSSANYAISNAVVTSTGTKPVTLYVETTAPIEFTDGKQSLTVICEEGGSYDSALVTTSAENYEIRIDTDGNTRTFYQVRPIAMIGETVYYSIPDALDDANDGDTINVLEGTFDVGSDTITITKPVTITGTGKNGTTLNFTASGKCAFEIKSSNVTIENMTIKQNSTSEATTLVNINSVAYSDITLHNLKLTSGKQAMAIKGVTNLIVDSCDFNQSSSAVLLYRTQGDTVFSNNTFALGSSTADSAIFMTTVYGVDNGSTGTLTLRDNTLTSGKSFYYLEGAKSDMNLKLEIVGNVISNYSNKGIIFYTGSLGNYYESITITNNVFNKAGKYAIERVKEDSTLDIDASYNYWGSVSPNFNSLLRYVYNNNIITEPYYRAYDNTLTPSTGALSDLYPPVRIGDTLYTSIAKALEAVQAGETIELLANLEENVDCSAFTTEFYLDCRAFENTGTFTAAEGCKLKETEETGLFCYSLYGTITFAAGEGGPETVTLPADMVDYKPSTTNVMLAIPLYNDDSKSFAGWKVADSDPAQFVDSIAAGVAPSYDLVATWRSVQTIEIQTADGEDLSAIKVDETWIDENPNLTSSSTAEEIRTELEKTDANGLKAWENYVLGQDPSAAVKIDGEQSETTVMPVLNTLAPQAIDTGFTVSYSLDQVATNGEVVVEGVRQATPEFELDLSEVTSNAYYRMTATITAIDGSGAEVHVVSTNTIGVLKVESDATTTAIAVPWESLSGSGPISVSNIVRTATLTSGDALKAYDPVTGKYKAWTLDENKTWQPNITATTDSSTTAPEADDYTIARGSAVWLTRQDTTQPIYLVGAASGEKATVSLEAGTSENPSWNLVGSTSTEPVSIAALIPDASTGDKVSVPTAYIPKEYEYNSELGKWGYWDYETYEKNGRKRVRRVFKTDATIPAGTGFWYISSGSTETIDL